LIIDTDTLNFKAVHVDHIRKIKRCYDHPLTAMATAQGDDFVLRFKTGPEDMQAPALLSVYPPNRSTNAEVHPIINMRFDEAIDSASVTPNIFA
jgi:hypothetical protein